MGLGFQFWGLGLGVENVLDKAGEILGQSAHDPNVTARDLHEA